MSTVFAIFEKEPETDHHGQLTSEDMWIPHIPVAFRDRGGISFKDSVSPIIAHLPDETPVYPLDNSPQDIYTIGDIRKETGDKQFTEYKSTTTNKKRYTGKEVMKSLDISLENFPIVKNPKGDNLIAVSTVKHWIKSRLV